MHWDRNSCICGRNIICESAAIGFYAKHQRSLRSPPRCERRVQQLHKDAKNAATQFMHLWQQYNLQICGHWVLCKASKKEQPATRNSYPFRFNTAD